MLSPLTREFCVDFVQELSQLLSDPVFYATDAARGDNTPVLLIPGFSAGDWSLAPMAGWLARIGYRPYLSGIDWNVGCPDKKLERLEWRLDQVRQESTPAVVLVGHSLGGILARALAARRPEQVRAVVTLGSPTLAQWRVVNPRYRSAIRSFQEMWRIFCALPQQCGTAHCECRFGETIGSSWPRTVKFTSIYTRNDSIVDWHACVSPDAENYEVSAAHSSMVVSHEVYRLLAALLAQNATSHTVNP